MLKLKAMDKAAIDKAMRDRGRGERARVLFDCLMECLECDQKMNVSDIFIRLKEVLQAEADAIRFLLPTQRMPKEGESPQEYAERFQEESDGVSLSD